MAPTRDKWIRRFVITETSRHKSGFTIYKVTSLVFLKTSPDLASKVSVWKRYNDFKKLHESLHNIYQRLNIKESYPSFPKGKYFSRFDNEVIKERRDSAIKLLEFIGRHQSLATSEIFVKFFESSLQLDSIDCSESISSDTSEETPVTPAASHGIPCSPLIPQKIHEKSSSPVLNLKHNLKSKKIDNKSSEISIIDDNNSDDFGQYVIIAAAHMSAGYRHESMCEHEEAFMQYKLGITNLLQGVQMDPDPIRQRRIREKIKKYTDRAETLYDRYLNSNISLFNRPIDELKNYKVVKVLNSVMLVRDIRTNVERIIKTVEKVSGERDDIGRYILRGKVPFVVKLNGFVQTETTVFLILNYVKSGKLWESILKRFGVGIKEEMPKKNLFSMEKINNDFLKSNDEICHEESPERLEKEFVDNSIFNENLPTIKLLEKAQELLKSVDATIKKSNSIADRLNEKNCLKDFKNNDDYESEYSVSESSSGSFEKIDISDVSNDFSDYDVSKMGRMGINSRGIETSEDSGVEMEQELWKIPEGIVKQWTAQIIVALEFFHRQNVIMKNLKPDNLLVDHNDNVIFCYVVPIKTEMFRVEFRDCYTAPELCQYSPEIRVSGAADVWSFGVILYELLTGIEFQTRHPGPYYSHSILSIPSDLSDDAKSLLRSILIFEASERLTIKQIKHHPFYKKIQWETVGFPEKSTIVKPEV